MTIPLRKDTVYFSDAADIPSNFYRAAIELECPVRLSTETWPTNEHYFQAAKVAVCGCGTIDMVREIQRASGPGRAKQLGRQVPLSPAEIELWDRRYALVAMLECNLVKYQQHYECWLWLHETGVKRLVERRRDPIWGDNLDGSGKNLLGRTLELVRALVS